MNKIKPDVGKKQSSQNSGIEFVVAEPSGLLDFLLLNLSNRSRNNVKSLLTHREVSVDKVVVTQYDYALREGQKVQISRSINREKSPEDVLNIIYEDHDMIVINKPSGLLSVATDKQEQLTAYHLLMDYVRKNNPKGRVFVVHRLDRDTSGVFMIAKNERIKLALQDNWGKIVSERGYIAIVEGHLKEQSGRIKSWLRETKTHLMYSSSVEGDGQESITNYQVIKQTPNYSMLDIRLETGRKNQIRVHMKDLGHPVVGDKVYGAKSNPLKRLGLHAHKLEFEHPFSHKVMSFEAQLPNNFLSLFDKTGKVK
ncbi:RluA family pseudouridine synthase [Oscillospiraceae bacterium PP1C4]